MDWIDQEANGFRGGSGRHLLSACLQGGIFYVTHMAPDIPLGYGSC